MTDTHLWQLQKDRQSFSQEEMQCANWLRWDRRMKSSTPSRMQAKEQENTGTVNIMKDHTDSVYPSRETETPTWKESFLLNMCHCHSIAKLKAIASLWNQITESGSSPYGKLRLRTSKETDDVSSLLWGWIIAFI